MLSLFIPPYIAAASALVLLPSLFIRHENNETPDNQPAGFWAEVKAHVAAHGGIKIFLFKLARLIACIVLLVLTIATLLIDELHDVSSLKKKKKHKKQRERDSEMLTRNEWIQLAMAITFLYASLLALLALTTKPVHKRVKSFLDRLFSIPVHLNILLSSTFIVYAVRDLYPLLTYALAPIDLHFEPSHLLYSKITLLGVVAIVVPLTKPRVYVPFDPQNPEKVPAPEQTCSILSLILYTFLDPIVLLAYHMPHLPHDKLPPLADYDKAANLRAISFPQLDPLTCRPQKRRHIFWGLMRVFRREYITLGIMLILQVVAGFAAPLGINRLLRHLETNGRESSVRPWFWILWLFFGPLLGSVAFQWYIYIATRTLVRTECIITQLVFEHALKIRVKAEASSSPTNPTMTLSAPSTPSTSATQLPPEADSSSPNNNDNDADDASGSNSRTSSESTAMIDKAVSSTSKKETIRSSLTTFTSRIQSKLRSPSRKSSPSPSSPKPKEDQKDKEVKAGPNLIGKITNLITTDLGNITEARDFLMVLVYMPMQICLCIAFLYVVLGWSAFVGLATMLLLFPLPGFVGKMVQIVQTERMKRTDARVQDVTETMSVLRMIKLFGWERKMTEKVAQKREEELKWIWRRQLLELVNGNVKWLLDPGSNDDHNIFYITVIMRQELNASKVFSSMAVFDMLRDQLHIVIWSITNAVQGKVSLDRVDTFLNETELLDVYAEEINAEQRLEALKASRAEEDDGSEDEGADAHSSPTPLPSPSPLPADLSVIGFRDASFTWSAEINPESGASTPGSSTLGSMTPSRASFTSGMLTPSRRKFVLRIDGELFFKPGCVNLVVGPTGSGKTSLLMALLGEMHFIPTGPTSWFNLPRQGGVSYAAQESWVQNETIRDNIIFGAPFDEERYKKVIYQCCLERDIAMFEAGDKTEVGEKGLTLSGGQKARITLARAIYSRAEIILLDDVLAALDVHTAKWIVDKCFSGDLIKGRTVILVTHNVTMASPIADFVVSLGLDGRVLSQGTVSDALAKDRILAKEVSEERKALDKTEDEVDSSESGEDTKKPDGKLIVEEEIEVGHVGWPALKMYLLGLCGKHPILFFVAFIGGLFLTEFCNAIQTWFLGYWASQYDNHSASEVSVSYYLSSLLMISVLIYSASYIVYVFGNLRASRSLHMQLIDAVLGTTLRWLDTTPTSRVITRCTQDIRAVDGPINQTLGWLSELTTSMLIKFGAVVVLTPIFLGPGVLIAFLGGWCGQIYMKAQLSVKREMSNAKSPVLGHFGAAIAGLTSIRAYGAQEAFRKESLERIDKYTRAARTFYNLNRWICIRIDALGGLFSAGLAAYLVYFRGQTASNTGFSLNMAVGFSGMILWWVRILNDFEVQGNSLERIQGYVRIEQEPKPTEDGKPPAYWPASGDIRVEKLSARYSPAGPEVLHDISFHIQSGERVGVVGRTGSGKSSLTLALLRCIYTDGTVYYDGFPTSKVNLDALRSNITIIPQVPELLSGTLRQNLDPFDQYDDATLNDALRAAGLFSLQNQDDEGRITLDTAISSGGGNLSVGQRQILALARAIVRGSKLLILDEATSAIDYKTDSVIQSSLRNELGGDVTLITVAHRLQTIMDADKIMVLDAGRIVEFDSPTELLKNQNGKLRSLVDQSGDKDILIAMAENKTSK